LEEEEKEGRRLMFSQNDIPDLAARLANQAEAVCRHLLPGGKRVHNEWFIGDVSGAKGDSLRVHLTGDKAGVWMDFANPSDTGDLVELWTRARRISKGNAIKEIKDWLGIQNDFTPPRPRSAPKKPPTIMKPISSEYHQMLRSRLSKNKNAMDYLTGPLRGLEIETIKYFGLGLSQPYPKDSATPTSSDAVTAPMISPVTGRYMNRNYYISVPGVTQDSESRKYWGTPTATYWAQKREKHTSLFVCEGLKDTWSHWQALSKTGMTAQMMLISSTHGSAFPDEWEKEEFWASWENIYLGQDNDDPGNATAERLLNFVGREVRRVEVPKVPKKVGEGNTKDWTDFWQNGGTFEDFRKLIDNAPVASAKVVDASSTTSQLQMGKCSYNPVDINGAYVRGHLYYPTEILDRKIDEETGQIVERLETLVVRSDRTFHRSHYSPAPKGTPKDKLVLKLSDGTIIEKEPRASSASTWDFESINAYINGRTKTRSLSAIIEDVLSALKQAVWLPREDDYAVLALMVPVTYVQTVFDSVPLILLNGPAGSGKTQTGNTCAKLCANGTVIGLTTAASAARLIDETRGFVVLDDVEAIATRAGKDAQMSEFVQALKVSYNQQTAIKVWTDIKTMRTEKLNFFGVKMLNNTLGADSILGSRMIRIQTREIPKGTDAQLREFSVEDLRKLRRLRNELHVWSFENVQKVDQVYREIYAHKTDRIAEIAAPLRTMAQLVGDPSKSAALERAIERQQNETRLPVIDDPVEILREAVKNIIKQGYSKTTLTHVLLEMRCLLDPNFGMRSTTDIPEWQSPEWVGRQLRCNDFVEETGVMRQRFFGRQLRLVKISDWLVKEVTQNKEGGQLIVIDKTPEDFCRGCSTCPYQNAGCELQKLRNAGKALRGSKNDGGEGQSRPAAAGLSN
jgi:hypothetical protein